MPRPDKVAAVDEVKSGLSGSAATLLTDYRGLTVTELAELRAELRKNNAAYKVVKNTLTRLAASEAGIEGLDDYLVGPTALVFCEDDPVGPAKVLRAFAKDHPELIVKAGYVDGQLLDEAATVRLADLESREELLAKLAGMMNNALAGFARLMQAALVDMGRAMKALEDAGGVEAKGFAPADAGVAEASDDASAAGEPEEDATDEDAEDGGIVEKAAVAAVDTVAGAAGTAAGVAAAAAAAVADGAEAVAGAVNGDDEADEADEAADDEADQDDEK